MYLNMEVQVLVQGQKYVQECGDGYLFVCLFVTKIVDRTQGTVTGHCRSVLWPNSPVGKNSLQCLGRFCMNPWKFTWKVDRRTNMLDFSRAVFSTLQTKSIDGQICPLVADRRPTHQKDRDLWIEETRMRGRAFLLLSNISQRGG